MNGLILCGNSWDSLIPNENSYDNLIPNDTLYGGVCVVIGNEDVIILIRMENVGLMKITRLEKSRIA